MDAVKPICEHESISPPQKKLKLAMNSELAINSDNSESESENENESDSDSESDRENETRENDPLDDASDDDGGSWRKWTKEEENRYYKQVKESDGFDVDDFTDVYAFGLIIPIPAKSLDGHINKAFSAIELYNDKKNAKLELVRIMKGNRRLCGSVSVDYYITFEAKDAADGQTKVFQAFGSDYGTKFKVKFCRRKHSQ